jgi:hypothetical protein
MNERIEKLIEQCTVQEFSDCTGGFETFDKEKFAELIVRECIGVVDRDDGATHVQELLLKHFGVEEQVTESNEWHTCPYAEEIHNDYETLCDCDEEQQRQCAMDI